jgi:Domain of unknown function (DUF4158)
MGWLGSMGDSSRIRRPTSWTSATCFLDDADVALIGQKRTDRNRLGLALQGVTVRFLCGFLTDRLEVPEVVVEHLPFPSSDWKTRTA